MLPQRPHSVHFYSPDKLNIIIDIKCQSLTNNIFPLKSIPLLMLPPGTTYTVLCTIPKYNMPISGGRSVPPPVSPEYLWVFTRESMSGLAGRGWATVVLGFYR